MVEAAGSSPVTQTKQSETGFPFGFAFFVANCLETASDTTPCAERRRGGEGFPNASETSVWGSRL